MFKSDDGSALILIGCLMITFHAAELDINMELPAQEIFNEPTLTKSLDIRAQTLFTHPLSSLQPPKITNEYCWYEKGDIILHDQSLIMPDETGDIADNFIYFEKYQLIYRLNAESLSVFQLNGQSIQMIRSENFPESSSECSRQLAATSDEQFLFVFDCDRVFRLGVKKMIISAEIVIELSSNHSFNGYKVIRVDDLFIWLSLSQGLKIFELDAASKLSQSSLVLEYSFIADCVFHDGRLYLLEDHQWVHVLEKAGKSFRQVDKISLNNINTDLVNMRIFVNNRNLYVYSLAKNEEFVTELYYYNHRVELIRYFKGFHTLIFMDIFRGKLLLIDQHSAQYLEVNKDPRTIEQVDAGVSNNHLTQIFYMYRLNDNNFLALYFSSLKVLQISIRYPSLNCQFPPEAAYQTFEIQVDRQCQEKKNRFQEVYYKHCTSVQKLILTIGKQPNIFHYYAIVLVFLFCISMILFMIAWRKGKLQVIEQLLKDINQTRRKNKQNIEFVEEHIEVRQSNWHDIRDDEDQQEHPGSSDNQPTNSQNQRYVEEISDDNEAVATERQMMQIK